MGPANVPFRRDLPLICYQDSKWNLTCRRNGCSMPHRDWVSFSQAEKQAFADMVANTNGLEFVEGVVAPPSTVINLVDGAAPPPPPPHKVSSHANP